MVLEEYRRQADPYLNPVAAYFVRTHPNTMTWLAFVFAVLAGLTFVASNFLGEYSTAALLPAAVLIFLNGIFDALDGKVARLAKRESRRGDFLDHVLDRYADFFIIGGITVSPFCDPWIGVLAILGVIFASYMGTQAQAVGIRRDYSGLLGRADRLVLLILLPLVQLALESARLIPQSHHFPVRAGGMTINLSVIEILMIWFAIAGNTTALQRARASWKELGRREGRAEPPAVPDAAREPAPATIEETEEQLDRGRLDLAEATARLRDARLAIERDMRGLREKEIRLRKLETRIQRRQTEARRK
ncbi:MAG: CDP-alcohol phosphatidyltransferase family protein [Euryarchaeota archaeon]|nr:CDP-alcohol phosphatidyltransferase family protein [Euryarchaeota archaeon]